MFAIDHRIRSGPLLREMDNCFRLNIPDDGGEKFVVSHIAGEKVNRIASNFPPGPQPLGQWTDGRKCMYSELVIPLAAREVVGNGDRVSFPRQVKRCGPATVAISAQNRDLQLSPPL